MDRRYQVFVSSTYEDLHDERREVMQGLLALKCIPTGMELFPAANDYSWTHIQRFIAECDYYVVIVGGRYGSKAKTGKSYTEMEYDYAVEVGLPTLAFLHENPGTIPANKTEPNDDGKVALAAFRKKIESTRHVKYWSSSGDLATKVALGVVLLINNKPGVGWVRGSELAGEGLKDELLRLRREIDSLNVELTVAKDRAAPEGVEDLAQGSERTNITIDFEPSDYGSLSLELRWDSLMRAILPHTFGGGAPPEAIINAIGSLVVREAEEVGMSQSEDLGRRHKIVASSDYGKVTNQMVALGLIEAYQNPTNPLGTLWRATPYGIKTGSRLLAIRSEEPE